MTEILALKYRPVSFNEIIGQNVNAAVLNQMVSTDSLPHGLLFSGPRGSGKTSTARIIASQTNSDLIEIDAASHGLVDDARALTESVRYTPASGRRLIVIDEAHSMSKEAFNAVLKTLEEPPEHTSFIFVTTDPSRIPETVKSRLMEFSFRKVSPKTIRERLEAICRAETLEVDPGLLEYISERSDGSVRDAIMLLDQCQLAGIKTVEEFLQMSGEEDVAPELLLSMLTGDSSLVFKNLDEAFQHVPDPASVVAGIIRTLKDVLVLSAGGKLSIPSARIEVRKKLAYSLEPERIVSAMQMLWDFKIRLRQSSDPRSNLDLLVVLIMNTFTAGRQKLVHQTVQEQPERKLTLEEL